MIGRGGGSVALLLAALAWPAGARGLETDQYYAWGRNLDDATALVDAKVNAEIGLVLDKVNRSGNPRDRRCEEIAALIGSRFRQFILHDIEVWALNSQRLSRAPAGPEEEERFRRESLYHRTGRFDVGTWIPPSPTIEAAGVRLGTDKLSHFFSMGWWYYRWYRAGLRRGLSEAEAVERAVRRGYFSERTSLGLLATGIFSPADLEANYEGMRFYAGLCRGENPSITLAGGRWVLKRPFSLASHLGPEWDESFQPCVYGKRRWKKVRPVLLGYCEQLGRPEVTRQREAYARRDRVTPTERFLQRQIAEGKLPDPDTFSLRAVCAAEGALPGPRTAAPTASSAIPGGDSR